MLIITTVNWLSPNNRISSSTLSLIVSKNLCVVSIILFFFFNVLIYLLLLAIISIIRVLNKRLLLYINHLSTSTIFPRVEHYCDSCRFQSARF